MNNNVAYQIRVRKAAQQLSGVGSPTMRQFRYRINSGGTLGDPGTSTSSDVRSPTRTEVRSPTSTRTDATTTGNKTSTDGSYNTTTNYFPAGYTGACDCSAPRSGPHSVPRSGGSPRLRNVAAKKIGSYKLVTGVRSGLSGIGMTERPVAALIPVSDRSAVTNAVKVFAARRAQQLHGYRRINGFGDTAQTQSSVSTGAQGAAAVGAAYAAAGSIVPGIGTVIGFVVGAVVGWIAGKAKPVRASAQQIAECKTLTTEYMGYAAENPDMPLPLEIAQIKGLHWCGDALYGGSVKLKDPRYFAGGFDEKINIYRQIVRRVYDTPVGATVEISGLNFKDAKGKTINLPGINFVNKTFISIKELVDRVVVPLETANCSPWGGGACPGFYSIPLIRRILYDELGYAARVELPNISEADLKAASEVATTIPSTSAKDVVSAVEMILKRPVVREETAALLTPQAAIPGQAAPAPQIPITAIAPLIPVVQANPIDTTTYTPQAPVPATPTTTYQLPSVSAGGGGYTTLAPSVPAQQSLPVLSAGLPGGNSVWIAGGLGILAVLFATARPMGRK